MFYSAVFFRGKLCKYMRMMRTRTDDELIIINNVVECANA